MFAGYHQDQQPGMTDLEIFSHNPTRSVFVRDLPYFCSSNDLAKFFYDHMQIPILHAVVCKNKKRRTLQFGCVLLDSEDSVQLAREVMNGKRFVGRDIRVLPYDPNSPLEASTTGLIHVSFKALSPQCPLISEASLRDCFDSYGEIEHVSIRSHKYSEVGLQGGYGFLTFKSSEVNRGVVNSVRQLVINDILFDCSWSESHTQKVLGPEGAPDFRSQESKGMGGRHPARMNSVKAPSGRGPFDQTVDPKTSFHVSSNDYNPNAYGEFDAYGNPRSAIPSYGGDLDDPRLMGRQRVPRGPPMDDYARGSSGIGFGPGSQGHSPVDRNQHHGARFADFTDNFHQPVRSRSQPITTGFSHALPGNYDEYGNPIRSRSQRITTADHEEYVQARQINSRNVSGAPSPVEYNRPQYNDPRYRQAAPRREEYEYGFMASPGQQRGAPRHSTGFNPYALPGEHSSSVAPRNAYQRQDSYHDQPYSRNPNQYASVDYRSNPPRPVQRPTPTNEFDYAGYGGVRGGSSPQQSGNSEFDDLGLPGSRPVSNIASFDRSVGEDFGSLTHSASRRISASQSPAFPPQVGVHSNQETGFGIASRMSSTRDFNTAPAPTLQSNKVAAVMSQLELDEFGLPTGRSAEPAFSGRDGGYKGVPSPSYDVFGTQRNPSSRSHSAVEDNFNTLLQPTDMSGNRGVGHRDFNFSQLSLQESSGRRDLDLSVGYPSAPTRQMSANVPEFIPKGVTPPQPALDSLTAVQSPPNAGTLSDDIKANEVSVSSIKLSDQSFNIQQQDQLSGFALPSDMVNESSTAELSN